MLKMPEFPEVNCSKQLQISAFLQKWTRYLIVIKKPFNACIAALCVALGNATLSLADRSQGPAEDCNIFYTYLLINCEV